MAVVDTVRTTLGPRGMDKLVHDDRVRAPFSIWTWLVLRIKLRHTALWLHVCLYCHHYTLRGPWCLQGKVTISNDGATIMKLLDIVHPAAKVLADISMSQDAEVSSPPPEATH